MEQYPDLMSNPQSIVNDEAHKELSDRHLAKLRADTPTSLDQDAKLQVVDENQEFTQDLNRHMADWNLLDSGFGYNVVAVFGSQSTGKSTLLNGLFGTKFDVMNENERRQTTKGIWMSKGEDMNVLVMDVEGTDGRERGEDQDFERKSALFSIAVSEILIVNIWEHQVGLYQGANMGLLKTVFEVNLALFLAAKEKGKISGSAQDKTLLLFVIRDHIGATPLANLQATLTADLNRLWDNLSKPPGLESCLITTFFDLAFVTLPHKLLMPEKFVTEIKEMRSKFTDKSSAGYVFQQKYHKRIPADGISQYMETIWDAVVTNKDLDLPTQQELLAQFRCDEIAVLAFAAFQEDIKKFPQSVAGKIIPELGAMMERARSGALSSFDTSASRYHTAVYTRKRIELSSKLNSTLHPYYLTQLKNLHKSILRDFRKSIQEGLRTEGYDFGKVVRENRARSEKEFVEGAKETKLSETEWSEEESETQLKEDMIAIADLLRAEETKKMISIIERNIKKQINETIELNLDSPTPDMWDKILVIFKAALQKGEEIYNRKATSFNATSSELVESIASLRLNAWQSLRAKIDEQSTEPMMLVRLKLIFEEKFRYDKEGVPRVWKEDDEIEPVFKKARDEVLVLLPLYSNIAPVDSANAFNLTDDSHAAVANTSDEPFDFATSLTILSASRVHSLTSRFRREADTYYIEVKRSLVSSNARIPLWIYGILILLGWNEFIAVLRNPVWFLFLIMAATGGWVLYQMNMSGPAFTVAKGVANETIRAVTEQIHNYFESQRPTAPAQRRREEPIEASFNEQVEMTESKRSKDD